MEIAFAVTWFDVLLIAGVVWIAWGTYKIGKRAGYKDSYQSELNYKMEDFLEKQKKNSDS